MDLKNIFSDISGRYTTNIALINSLWIEIEKNYSLKNRYYHNLIHLENMICELESVREMINDFDAVLFSIFYHDIIYKSTAKNNEEKSAETAKERLKQLEVPSQISERIYFQILATKPHSISDDDTNFLTDADLSILGKSCNEYEKYISQIRKEYSIYPDFLYKPGRKKVLQHFLEFDSIYKTEFFKNKYEKQARENIQREINIKYI